MSVPILFIVFNRPHITKKTFEAIREYKPQKLYIAADAPREQIAGDVVKCRETRDYLINAIDWDCKVETLFHSKNQGCKYGPISAINWFFEHEPYGVILEDDCIPHPSFFPFCDTLLEHYKNDTRVMMISGNNYQNKQYSPYGYYFSRQSLTWGWATWRRAWQFYEDLDSWPECKNQGWLLQMFDDKIERDYWQTIWDKVYDNKIPAAWDYQWIYTVRKNNGLSITPVKNLVSNIGFGLDATHTKNPDIYGINFPVAGLADFSINPFVIPNREADTYNFNTLFGGFKLRQQQTISYKINRFFNYLYVGSKKQIKKFFAKITA